MQNERKLKDFFAGDDDSAEALIREHEDALYGLCVKLTGNGPDADDLYQQTWLKALSKLSAPKDIPLKNWLYTVCLNTFRDQYRKRKRRERIAGSLNGDKKEYAIETALGSVSAEAEAMDKLTSELLTGKIALLPERHRLAVVMYYFEGLDYEECANSLRIPLGTLKSRLSAAKKKLRAEMEKELNV